MHCRKNIKLMYFDGVSLSALLTSKFEFRRFAAVYTMYLLSLLLLQDI